MNARPFIKNAGGKTQLLPELLKRVPPTFNTYHEPFVGGGALFWALQPPSAMLNDVDTQLIAAYTAVRDDAPNLIRILDAHQSRYRSSPEVYYYEQRKRHNSGMLAGTELAASVIFLSKTGFNGLRRFNRAGKFNVPWNKNPNSAICDISTLLACKSALHGAHLSMFDFQGAVTTAARHDFVYFDSPYVPVSETANFTTYTAGGFTAQDQVRLRDTALALKERGVYVMLSNAAVPVVEDLYVKDFVLERVAARRNINSKGTSRGAVGEYIIR